MPLLRKSKGELGRTEKNQEELRRLGKTGEESEKNREELRRPEKKRNMVKYGETIGTSL